MIKHGLPLEVEESLERELAGSPIVYCEVGARKGGRRFRRIGKFVQYYGFEPDVGEAERLSGQLEGARVFKAVSVLPRAVLGKSGSVSINLLRHRGCSSALLPNVELISQFTARRADTSRWFEYFDIVGQYQCDAVSLDEFVEKNNVPSLDFLGLDTQGTEYEILAGGRNVIAKSTLVIHVEMEIVPLYKGQPLMTDIMAFLSNLGFRLISLENHQYISRWPAGADDMTDQGELISVDGIFCREMNEEFFAAICGDPKIMAKHMLVLYELNFRTLAIDAGRRFQALHGGDRCVEMLTRALKKDYYVDNCRARPMGKRVNDVLRGIMPAGVRKSLRPLVSFWK